MSLFDIGQIHAATTLADLLAIESSPELLALRCPVTGIPVWPNIRIAFFRRIMADVLFASGSMAPPNARLSWRAVAALGNATVHNLRASLGRQLRSDVIINTEAIGDELRDGRWFNRYVDPFGDLPSGQAVILTDMFEWALRRPRHNERVYHHAPIQTGAVLAGRLRRSRNTDRLARAATDIISERAESLIGWRMGAARRNEFVRWTSQKLAGLPYRYRAYRRLLQHARPRLLLGSSGCYGTHAPLLAAAHDLGVVTAEYQHGVVSAGHDAYNFAPLVQADMAYRRTLPQYLLTYGRWWGDQIDAPVECVAVGYPARADKIEGMGPLPADRRTVLILSDGIEFDLYLDLARSLSLALRGSGLVVALRPHPLERSSVHQRHGDVADGIAIDTTPDIYSSFVKAHSVVSELSTGLFEAVGLVERIVLLDTAKARFAFPEHPFAAVRSADEAAALIVDPARSAPKVDGTDLWAPDWRANYAWFLAEKVGIGR